MADMAGDTDHRQLVETSIDSESVFDGELLHVRRDTVRLPDGNTATREYIVHPGAVLIVPVGDDGRLIVERQFRFPLHRVMIEFPAGKRDPGESALEAARRELIEEAGYSAATWTPLGRIHTGVAYTTEAIDFFLAEHLTHVGAKLDEGEFLEIDAMTCEQMLEAIDRGDITDAKTVAAVLLYARRCDIGSSPSR
jgi:ADP-ribose pyrophosphatase